MLVISLVMLRCVSWDNIPLRKMERPDNRNKEGESMETKENDKEGENTTKVEIDG